MNKEEIIKTLEKENLRWQDDNTMLALLVIELRKINKNLEKMTKEIRDGVEQLTDAEFILD